MEGDGDTEHANLFYIHGWAMWTSWAVLGYIMIVSNRYLKRFWRVHLWIHGIVGFLILACTLTMGLLVIKNLNWQISSLAHTVMGLVLLCTVGFIAIGGLLSRYLMVTLKWKTKFILLTKLGHKIFGWILIGYA